MFKHFLFFSLKSSKNVIFFKSLFRTEDFFNLLCWFVLNTFLFPKVLHVNLGFYYFPIEISWKIPLIFIWKDLALELRLPAPSEVVPVKCPGPNCLNCVPTSKPQSRVEALQLHLKFIWNESSLLKQISCKFHRTPHLALDTSSVWALSASKVLFKPT